MIRVLSVQLYAPQDVAKRTLIRAVFVLRRNCDHVEQISIARLSGDNGDGFRLTGRSVEVTHCGRKTIPASERCALQASALA